MQLYGGWGTQKSKGENMTILQLLARADTEYKLLLSLGQWTTKNKSSELLVAGQI